MKKILFIIVLLLAGFWQYDQNRVIGQADGEVAGADPIQRDLSNRTGVGESGLDSLVTDDHFTQDLEDLA